MKEILANELTNMVHGKEEADKALEAAKAPFSGGADNSNMPTTQLPQELFQDGSLGILDLLVDTGLAPSKSEGRRLVQQGGISVNEEKIVDPTARIPAEKFAQGDIIVKKGKKVFHKVKK